MDLLLRAVLVLLVVGTVFAVTGAASRRRGPRARLSLAPGIVVVTGPGCRLCGPAIAAIERAGGEPRLVDVSDPAVAVLGVRSLPTAVVVDGDGTVAMRRSGRSAVDDAAALVAGAAAVQAL